MASNRRSNDLVPIEQRDDPFMKDPFFSSTWDEFGMIRSQMMEEQKDFWKR